MNDLLDDLALSRTFKVVGGKLSLDGTFTLPMESTSEFLKGGRPPGIVGSVIDSKYQVLALLGEGGMGSVYRVLHLLLDKEVALKTFRTAQPSPEAWARFQIEARAIGRLNHANIIQVFDFGVADGSFPYYTMELLSGRSLGDEIGVAGPMNYERAIPVFFAVADALAHAHRQGILHRDIKPSNIFMEKNVSGGFPKIVDFGLAKLAGDRNRENQGMTALGTVFGSPLYMSPEQSMGLETDKRTDVYSFGCSLFQVLTGRPPFVGNSFLDTIAMHQTATPPLLVDIAPGQVFPQRVESIVARLLAKNLDERYQTFEEVMEDFLKVSSVNPVKDPSTNSSIEIARQGALVFDTRALDEALGGEDSEEFQGADDDQEAAHDREVPSGLKIVLLVVAAAIFFIGAGFVYYFHHQDEESRARAEAEARESEQAAIANKAGGEAITQHATEELRPSSDLRNLSYPVNVLPVSKSVVTDNKNESSSDFFSHTNTDGSVTYKFPNGGEALGWISWEKHDEKLPALGIINVPKEHCKTVALVAGRPFSENPLLFDRFRAGDVNFLELDRHYRWGSAHFSHIVRIKNLRCLLANNLELQAADFAAIDSLKCLIWLELSGGEFDAKELAKLSRLRDLNKLYLDSCEDLDPVLDKLRGSTSINVLSLPTCGLKDKNLQTLATMQNLKLLCINHNKITLAGLNYLSDLPGLNRLEIAKVGLGPECIETLHRFKALRYLLIDYASWTQSQQMRLQQALPPGCQVHRE
jgi:serine/threonine protein kinase